MSIGSLTDVAYLAIKNISDDDRVFIGGRGIDKYENNFVRITGTTFENMFNIFPNPTSKKFKTTVSPSTIKVQIIDINGKVLKKRIVKGETELNFELGNSGIYFVQIITSKVRVTQKVIIQ